MLYEAYEIRRTIRSMGGRLLLRPIEPLRGRESPLARSYPLRSVVAGADLYSTLQLTHDRPAFGVLSVPSNGEKVSVKEELVTKSPFASLVRFSKADGSSEGQPKVLIVPGLAGHFATLVRGTVATMLADHDVYVIDWHNARDVPISAGPFGLDEYIAHVMDFLRKIGPGVSLMAICQPAVACLAAASVMEEDDDPARPSNLILLAGPVDTRINPGRIARFAQWSSTALLERTMLRKVPSKFPGRGRLVYPGFVQLSGFMGMDPKRHARTFRSLYRDHMSGDTQAVQKTTEFYREYFAVLDIAGEFYLDTARRVFRDNDLPRGRFEWRGRQVDPSKITSSLFTIEGELDEMCTPGQTEAAHSLCTGIPAERRRHLLQNGVGHYGVFAGSTFEAEIYPQIRDFIAETAARVSSRGSLR